MGGAVRTDGATLAMEVGCFLSLTVHRDKDRKDGWDSLRTGSGNRKSGGGKTDHFLPR